MFGRFPEDIGLCVRWFRWNRFENKFCMPVSKQRSSHYSCTSFTTSGGHWNLLQLRRLQLCFAVKLMKRFVDCETSTDLPSASGRDHNDRIFVFGWTVPFIWDIMFMCDKRFSIAAVVSCKIMLRVNIFIWASSLAPVWCVVLCWDFLQQEHNFLQGPIKLPLI